MYPHQIRLGAPWERLELPSEVQIRRRFGRPRQLDDWERLWILAPSDVRNQVWRLNGTELGWSSRDDGIARAAVTSLLRDRNELVVTGATITQFAGATLEIGCRAWIQAVRVVHEGKQRVIIDLHSESSDDPLEIYVAVDGENMSYRGPLSADGPIIESIPVLDRSVKSGSTLRVDLICRSTVWDRVERTVAVDAS
jgi:hypothetical protein